MAGASLWAIFMRQNATRLRSSDCRGNKKKGEGEGENVRTCARVRARKHAAGVNQRDIFPQRENLDGDVKTKRRKARRWTPADGWILAPPSDKENRQVDVKRYASRVFRAIDSGRAILSSVLSAVLGIILDFARISCLENCQARNAETYRVKARRDNALIKRRTRVIQLAIAIASKSI